nr:uncharacterized protein CI109_002250 [Kwoniella shandongensis]KAA5529357.1 hypothetical protein CI109_002250 [Kwoniella shandongensis]
MSGAETSRDDQHDQTSHDDSHDYMATPHPLRKVMAPPPSSTVTAGTRSPADSFSTASGSPFPPLESSSDANTTSPYASTRALTSTPQSRVSRSQSRSLAGSTTQEYTTNTTRTSRHERTRSGTGSLGNSTHASRRDRWQKPGEMSGSFSGEEIQPLELGTEKSVPLNDHSDAYSDSQSLPELPSLSAPPAESPITRRLSSGHILLERPRKRGPSGGSEQLEQRDEMKNDPSLLESPNMIASQSSVVTTLHVPQQDRIPSLSRSEMSGTDTSVTSTPEGPVRNVSMMTPRSDGHQEYEVTGEYTFNPEAQSDQDENPTLDYHHEYEYTPQEEQSSDAPESYASPAKRMDNYSPAKQVYTPSIASFTTPGTVRGQPFRENSYNLPSAPTTALQDVTDAFQNTPTAIPFTPSPSGMSSKVSDFSTPRAPLDDAERRKSHVLAVLNSTSRVMRPSVKGTPHPLRRVSTAPASESIAEESSEEGSSRIMSLATPGMRSRLTVDQSGNESFVSVASSADLTSDRRASHLHSRLSRGNTSFPTILLPTNPSTSGGGSLKGLSDQRADGIKIHKHLNAMNKQLLETNAELAREAEAWKDEVERLKGVLREAGIEVEELDVLAGIRADRSGSVNESQQLPDWSGASPASHSGKQDHSELISRISSLSGRRRSSPFSKASTTAQDLLDGLSPEEHAAVLQEMAEKLESLEEGLNEKDEVINDLQEQLKIAKQSPSLTQEDLHIQIDKLSQQLEEAERARVSLHAEFSQKTEQHAKRFGEICSGFEEQVKGLEMELASAKGEVDRLRADKSRLERIASTDDVDAREGELRKQIQNLGVELNVVKQQAKTRADEVEKLKSHSSQLQEERKDLMNRTETAEAQVDELKSKLAEGEAEGNKADLESMKSELRAACEAQTAAEDEVARLEEEVADLRQTTVDQEAELDKQHEHIQELNRVVEDLDADLAAAKEHSRAGSMDGETVHQLQQDLEKVNALLSQKESEIESLRGKLEVADIASKSLRTSLRRSTSPGSTLTPTAKTPGYTNVSSSGQESFIAAMEDRLDEAYREIGRLKHEIGATPQRKSAIEVRDARIQALEREKAALADRLAAAKTVSTSTPASTSGMMEAASPFRPTPFVHKAIASLKTPRTPGPMKELSWLQTTIQDSNEPMLQAQIDYLQQELNNANGQLDNNFSRLESAGLGAIALAEKLAAAEDRISELEDEIRTLSQRNRASLALVSAHREERDNDNEGRLKKALTAVHQQMEELRSDIAIERSRLRKDNGRLNDLVSELKLKSRGEVDSFRAEIQRLAADAENDLRAAQDDLSRVTRERDDLVQDLQRSKSQITQLEQKVVNERRSRDSLMRKHAQSANNNEELVQKTQTIQSLQTSLRQANTDADRLRDILEKRERALTDSETRVNQYRQERETVARELASFEKDLLIQRAESEEFGVQLQALKREQNDVTGRHASEIKKLERELVEVKDRERRARRELESVQDRYEQVEQWRRGHACDDGLTDALIEQKAKFKAQSRELATQIRYLKAKFTREATFRNALALQKRYLLLLVGGMSLNEQATLRAISKMGFPVPEPPRPARSFKAVALAVLGVIRANNAAKQWRTERELKSSITSSNGERRRVSSRT